MDVDVKLLIEAQNYHQSKINEKQNISTHMSELKKIDQSLQKIYDNNEQNIIELLKLNYDNRDKIKQFVYRNTEIEKFIKKPKNHNQFAFDNLPYSLDEEIKKEVDKYLKYNNNIDKNACQKVGTNDMSIAQSLHILFTALKFYDSQLFTKKVNCDIKVRFFETHKLLHNISFLFNCFHQVIQQQIFGTFLASRNPDSIIVPKFLLTHHEGKLIFTVDSNSDEYQTVLEFIIQLYPELYKKFFKNQNLNATELGYYLNSNKRYVIITLGLIYQIGAHANMLIYDTVAKTIEHFEPCSYIFENIVETRQSIKDFFSKYVEVKEVYIIASIHELLKNSRFRPFFESFAQHWQRFESLTPSFMNKTSSSYTGGYCYYWSMLFAELRLLNPDVKGEDIHKKFWDCVRKYDISLKDYIRLYFTDIFLFMREFLYFCKKIGLKNLSDITLEISKMYLEWKYKIKY